MMVAELKTYPMLINGRMVITDERVAVINPATENVIGYVPECTQSLLDDAVSSARTAFAAWRHRSYAERQELLRDIAERIEAHAEELGVLLTSEQGKPLSAAKDEIRFAVWWLREMIKMELPIVISEEMPGQRSITSRRPLGVVGSIVPWNFPILLALWKIGPALLAGNAIVLKPSPFTPVTTCRIAELIAALVPPGVINIITGGDQLGPWLTEHPDIDKISFTGSTATGRKVMQSAASTLKRLTLELGGNDAAIVLDDFDIETQIEPLFWSAFSNSGQVCVATKRVYILDKIYDAVASALSNFARDVVVGDGAEAGVNLGPIQNKVQYERVRGIIEDSLKKGYRFLVGDIPSENRPGYFVPVTIIDNPPENSRVVVEEAFGPVLPLIRVKNVEDAIEKANASPFGLGGSIWSSDIQRAAEVAGKLDTGTVWINSAQNLTPYAPFAGAKQSGFGVEHGLDGLLEYTTPQTLHQRY